MTVYRGYEVGDDEETEGKKDGVNAILEETQLTPEEEKRCEELKSLKAWSPEYFELRERKANIAQRQRNSEDVKGIGDGSYG